MMTQPSWSIIKTSMGEGGEQNLCWKICSTDSSVFGVSLSATATWPRVKMVFTDINVDSLKTANNWVLESFRTFYCRVYNVSVMWQNFMPYLSLISAVYSLLERAARKACTHSGSSGRLAFSALIKTKSSIRTVESLDCFKLSLTTHLFTWAFNWF